MKKRAEALTIDRRGALMNNNLGVRWLGLVFVCLLLSVGLWAQAGSMGSAPAATAAQSPEITSSKPHDDSFVIGNDDVLTINVWKEPDVSQKAIPVRSDGKISLPLVGEVQAAGRTPLHLEQDIAARLKTYIADAEVTVMDAIAIAGGFRDFAKQKSIYILRQNPDGTQSRLPFNYKNVVKGQDSAQNVKLQPRDTIVVP